MKTATPESHLSAAGSLDPSVPGPGNDLVNGGARAAARVRGLRADRSAPVHLCRHCGAALAPAARESGFCCAGCAYVHRLVHEHGLEGYYRIRDAVVPPVDPAVFEPRDLDWLAEQARAAESGDRIPELVVGVQGISCAGCVWLIEKLFHEQPGALVIETDASSGRMRLRWSGGLFDPVAFARMLHRFGYLVGPAGAVEEEGESRRLLRRVGLCAAFAMNLMLFSLPRYFGMESSFPYARLFDTIGLVLATLAVLVGGTHFLGRAVRALRHRALHIDLPIALGIVGAYAGSVAGWLLDREQFIYFDFVGAFITLMLLGRWAQVAAVERNRRRLLQGQVGPQAVMLVTGSKLTPRAAEQVREGDVFELRAGQAVPVAARLESGAGAFGTAWITGEAEPRDYRAGGLVPAGAISLGREPVRLRATEGWSQSLLAQLLQPAKRDDFRHRTLERIVAGYLIAILAVAGAAAFGWWWVTHDPLRTAAVTIAVLVVSCPCAVGLAFPLADELAAVALRRAGVFVRETDLWPRLARIRQVVFDKTGTLTLENPTLRNPEALDALTPSARAALLALVRDSLHPVGRSLLEALLARPDSVGLAPATGTLREESGWGARLETSAGTWSLGKPGWPPARGDCNTLRDKHPEAAVTEFAQDGMVVARFRFADEARAGAKEEIAALRARGCEVFILSGDHPEKVAALAAEVGLPAEHAIGGATPQAKGDWIRAHDRRDTLMLGDGANDTLAFGAAFARGTPVVHRGLLESRADFYYLGRGLGGLRRMFEVDGARRRTHFWLLVFSVAYNTFAVGLAVAGLMNPLVAAILMPVSSLVSLAIVAGGLREAWER
jgi:Cu2+-exporting ATPase